MTILERRRSDLSKVSQDPELGNNFLTVLPTRFHSYEEALCDLLVQNGIFHGLVQCFRPV